MLAREFSRCDPSIVKAIRDVFKALQPISRDTMDSDAIMKKAVMIVAAFEYNVNQLIKQRSPITLIGKN